MWSHILPQVSLLISLSLSLSLSDYTPSTNLTLSRTHTRTCTQSLCHTHSCTHTHIHLHTQTGSMHPVSWSTKSITAAYSIKEVIIRWQRSCLHHQFATIMDRQTFDFIPQGSTRATYAIHCQYYTTPKAFVLANIYSCLYSQHVHEFMLWYN